MCKLAKYVRNCVVFWKNLHSWQKFYTTAGRDGRDKFQVCSGTTWAILGHHLRQHGDHLESLWNYMDNILGSLGEYFDNIWALLGTTYDKHCTMHYTMRCTMQTTMHHIMHRTMQPYYSPHYPLHCTLPSVMMMISHDRALRRFSRYNFDGFCAGVLFTSRQFDELVLGWRSITSTLSFRVLQILHQPL